MVRIENDQHDDFEQDEDNSECDENPPPAHEVSEGGVVLEGAEQQLQLLIADDLGELMLVIGHGFLIEDGLVCPVVGAEKSNPSLTLATLKAGCAASHRSDISSNSFIIFTVLYLQIRI